LTRNIGNKEVWYEVALEEAANRKLSGIRRLIAAGSASQSIVTYLSAYEFLIKITA